MDIFEIILFCIKQEYRLEWFLVLPDVFLAVFWGGGVIDHIKTILISFANS